MGQGSEAVRGAGHHFPVRGGHSSGSLGLTQKSPRVTRLSILISPFIIAKIFIRKLFQERPFYDSFGCFVLEKVDQHVLEPRVAVRSGRLFGKLVEPGVLFMECLLRTKL